MMTFVCVCAQRPLPSHPLLFRMSSRGYTRLDKKIQHSNFTMQGCEPSDTLTVNTYFGIGLWISYKVYMRQTK